MNRSLISHTDREVFYDTFYDFIIFIAKFLTKMMRMFRSFTLHDHFSFMDQMFKNKRFTFQKQNHKTVM